MWLGKALKKDSFKWRWLKRRLRQLKGSILKKKVGATRKKIRRFGLMERTQSLQGGTWILLGETVDKLSDKTRLKVMSMIGISAEQTNITPREDKTILQAVITRLFIVNYQSTVGIYVGKRKITPTGRYIGHQKLSLLSFYLLYIILFIKYRIFIKFTLYQRFQQVWINFFTKILYIFKK